jgi:hypothetical protein
MLAIFNSANAIVREGGCRPVLVTPNDSLTTTDLGESVMAKRQYICDSSSPSYPLLPVNEAAARASRTGHRADAGASAPACASPITANIRI